VSVVDYRQPEALQDAVAGADVAVHLAGALLPRRGETLLQANVETTRALVDAATLAGVKTMVYLSFPGADAASPNQYLCSKGKAEAAMQQAGFAGAIFRVPMILGPDSPSVAQLRRMASASLLPLVSGGAVRIQPIAEADVLAAIAWAIAVAPRPLRVLNLVGHADLCRTPAPGLCSAGNTTAGIAHTQSGGVAERLSRGRACPCSGVEPLCVRHPVSRAPGRPC
jgi:uncharacterized protein YbjT (DUF2867 family)